MKRKRHSKFTFTLNEVYTNGRYFYKFIRATPKGFNFLNTYYGKCALSPHLYCNKYIGVPMPRDEMTFEFRLEVFFAVERCIFLSSLVPKARLEEVRVS